MDTITKTRFKRKIRKYNSERLISVPPEIEGAFEWGEIIDIIFDGEKLIIESRKEKLTTEPRKDVLEAGLEKFRIG